MAKTNLQNLKDRSYREVQKIAKKHNINARQKKVVMIKEIRNAKPAPTDTQEKKKKSKKVTTDIKQGIKGLQHLGSKPYREIQTIARDRGINARQKKAALIQEIKDSQRDLADIYEVEGLFEEVTTGVEQGINLCEVEGRVNQMLESLRQKETRMKEQVRRLEQAKNMIRKELTEKEQEEIQVREDIRAMADQKDLLEQKINEREDKMKNLSDEKVYLREGLIKVGETLIAMKKQVTKIVDERIL